MRGRREVQVFGASFLDLLSGALGAVIILYILVPKLTVTVEEFEAQQVLAEELARLELSIDALAGLVPGEALAELQARLEQIETARQQVEAELEARSRMIEELRRDLAALTAEHAAVTTERDEARAAQAQAEAAQAQAEAAQARAEAAQAEADAARAAASEALARCEAALANCPPPGETIEGDQQFLIANLDWRTQFHDVDLHVIDPAGNEFYYAAPRFAGVPGELTLDNTCGPGFEVWQAIQPRPGTYRIYANLFSRRGSRCTATGTPQETAPFTLTVFHRNGVRSFTGTLREAGADRKALIATVVIDGEGNVEFR
jgi:hypothetical protein